MKRFTKEEVLLAVRLDWDSHMATLAEHKEAAELSVTTGGRYAHCWACGEWLSRYLIANGVTGPDAERACFTLGQRSLFGDPYAVAADILGRIIDGNPQQPGLALAEEINARHITPVENGVLVTRDGVLTEADPVVTARGPKVQS
jgi:hypothetical protein